jgi:nitrate reductase assembly molybdenum cofactor insertion protein NarJ
MTTSSTTLPDAAAALLAEAAEWKLLSLLFSCPTRDWRNQVAALANEVGNDRLQLAAQAALDEGLECDYHTAFGPGGPAAPREVSHRPTALSGQYLAELLAFYDVFGYSPPREEPPDHIAVEVDFVAYLKLKQAYALAAENEALVTVTAEATHDFISDHLVTLAQALAKNLETSGIRYLTLASTALVRQIGPPRETMTFAPDEFEFGRDPTLPICTADECGAENLD